MAATIDHTASMTQDSINEEEEFEGESQVEGDIESQRDLYLPSTPSDVSTENEIKEQKLIGSDALKNQRQKFLTSDKYLQKCEFKGRKNKNPIVQYMKEVEDKNIFPRGMGFIHRKTEV